MPNTPPRALLIFSLAGQTAALPLESVEKIAPMAQLARPQGLPSALEGILNLAGEAAPVLRLDRLFGLSPADPGLYSMLIILQRTTYGRAALLVDRVTEILTVPDRSLVSVDSRDSFNSCAEAHVRLGDRVIHLLSPSKILVEKERELLSEYQAMAQRRLLEWDPTMQ